MAEPSRGVHITCRAKPLPPAACRMQRAAATPTLTAAQRRSETSVQCAVNCFMAAAFTRHIHIRLYSVFSYLYIDLFLFFFGSVGIFFACLPVAERATLTPLFSFSLATAAQASSSSVLGFIFKLFYLFWAFAFNKIKVKLRLSSASSVKRLRVSVCWFYALSRKSDITLRRCQCSMLYRPWHIRQRNCTLKKIGVLFLSRKSEVCFC